MDRVRDQHSVDRIEMVLRQQCRDVRATGRIIEHHRFPLPNDVDERQITLKTAAPIEIDELKRRNGADRYLFIGVKDSFAGKGGKPWIVNANSRQYMRIKQDG